MAGCELNIAHAHAFVASPGAHRMRHDVMMTSADDFDASRRRQCVDGDDEAEVDRAGGVISHYRLVPSTFGRGGGGGSEWVTLSKSVLLQLVERICQLSFQTDSLSAAAATAAACSSAQSDRFDSSTAVLTGAVKSTDPPSSVVEAQEPGGRLSSPPPLTASSSDDVDGTASTSPADVVDASTTESIDELSTNDNREVEDVPASLTAMVESDDTGAMIAVDELTADEVNCDNDDDDADDSDVFTGAVPMQEDDKTTDHSSALADTPPSTEDSVVAAAAGARKLTSSSLRLTQSLRVERRRRLRELRRLRRRRRQSDEHLPLHDRGGGRHDAIARRQRFAVPRQPPPRFHDAATERPRRPASSSETSPPALRLPLSSRCGRLSQPWSALNKLVICQLVDVVLSQELAPIATTWRSATASRDKRRASGTIWNPAITPETRTPTPPPAQQLSPPSLNDLSSLASPTSAERGTSTLLHSLLSPTMAAAAAAAAAKTLLDRRRSDVDAEVAWTMPRQSSRRRHHSAAPPDTSFRAPWTPPPSFFWYNVPPSQGSFFLLPDAAAASRPCYRWISPSQTTAPPPPSCVGAVPLDYCTRTLDVAGTCPSAVSQDVCESTTGRSGPARRRDSLPSTPSSSSGRASAASRLKWVVVNKTDVCSLFESLASSMVVDGEEQRMSDHRQLTTDHVTSGTDRGSRTVSAAAGEPRKWKSTLLRRAQAEAQTPKHSNSDSDVTQKYTHASSSAD